MRRILPEENTVIARSCRIIYVEFCSGAGNVIKIYRNLSTQLSRKIYLRRCHKSASLQILYAESENPIMNEWVTRFTFLSEPTYKNYSGYDGAQSWYIDNSR